MNSNESAKAAQAKPQPTSAAVRSKEDLERFSDQVSERMSEALKAEGERRKALASAMSDPPEPSHPSPIPLRARSKEELIEASKLLTELGNKAIKAEGERIRALAQPGPKQPSENL